MKNKHFLLVLCIVLTGVITGGCSLCNISQDLFPIKMSEKYGFINSDGKEVIESKFDNVGDFSEELCAVKFQNKWGYIDKTGQFVIVAQYEQASDFNNGLAYVYTDTREGYINKKGDFIWSKELVKTKQVQNSTSSVPKPIHHVKNDLADEILNDLGL